MTVAAKPPAVVAPDGGWGWMIVASCFLTTICTRAVTRCISIFFVEFQFQFSKDYSTTAWIHSIVDCMTMLCAPLGSFIGNRLSHRVAVMLGGVLSSTGLVLSSFATSLEFLYVSLGIVTGMGFALSYTPAVAMVGMYFSERKALAYGLAMSGSGIGTFVLAPVVQLLIEHYSWRGALLILGGLVSHLCVCAALLRPVEEQKHKENEKKKGYFVTLPDGKQSEAKLTCMELSELKVMNETPVGEIFKDCKVEPSESIHVMNETSDNMCSLAKHSETNQDKEENTTCRNIQLPTKHPPNSDTEHSKPTDPTPVDSKLAVLALTDAKPCESKLAVPALTDATLCNLKVAALELTDAKLSDPKLAELELTDAKQSSSKLAVCKLTDAEICNSKLQSTKMADAKLLEINWVSPVVPVRTGWKSWCRAAKGHQLCLPSTEEYNFLLMTDFLLLSVSFLFLAYGCSVPFVYLVPYALSVGVNHQQAALLISILGVIGILGNITFGWMTDLSCLRPYRMVSYMLAVGLEGFSCFLVPQLKGFPLLVPFAILYGYFDGAYVALIPVVTSDIVGPSYLSSALGVVYFLHAIPYLISPPIGGWLVDQTGSYMTTFLLSGFSVMSSSVVLGSICLLRHCCRGHSGRSAAEPGHA